VREKAFPYDEYKGRYSMLAVVQASGIAKAGPQHSRTGVQFFCPFHADTKSASFHIRSRFGQCFGSCGWKGDIFDFIREWWRRDGIPFPEDHFEKAAVEWLEKAERDNLLRSGVVPDVNGRDWSIEAHWPYMRADVYHQNLLQDENHILYFLMRGCNWDTITRHYLGYNRGNHRYTIPIRNHIGLYGVKMRRDEEHYRATFAEKGDEWLRHQMSVMRYHRLEHAQTTGVLPVEPTEEDVYNSFCAKYIWGKGDCVWFWNEDRLLVRPQTYLPYVFLTADEMSGLILEQLGYAAVAMGSDASFPKGDTILHYRSEGKTFQIRIADVFQHVMKVYLVADNDDSGLAGAKRRALAIGPSKCEILRVPDKQFKDPADFYVGEGETAFRHWLVGIPTLSELGLSR